ncbi:MAG: hypothetical protein ABI830_02755 [Pseudolabrys sp.]
MKTLSRHLMLATALAGGLALALPFANAADAPQKNGPLESATVKTDPGFNPGTGQINTGGTAPTPSSSVDIRKIPSHKEAVDALLAKDDPNPSPGAAAAISASGGGGQTPAQNPAQNPANADGGGKADPTAASQGTAAIGGPLAPTAPDGAKGASGGAPQGSATNETTGIRPGSDTKQSALGPIGATGQTMPAKLSQRNDVLDRVPMMAWPMKLTLDERQNIYKAVMADKSQPSAGADTLKPADYISVEQAFNEIHPLPKDVEGSNAQLKGLTYMKAKNKVLLIDPTIRVVIDEIES